MRRECISKLLFVDSSSHIDNSSSSQTLPSAKPTVATCGMEQKLEFYSTFKKVRFSSGTKTSTVPLISQMKSLNSFVIMELSADNVLL